MGEYLPRAAAEVVAARAAPKPSASSPAACDIPHAVLCAATLYIKNLDRVLVVLM